MTKEIDLKAGKLYLLSGLTGSGKSTFLNKNKIDKDMIISYDTLRENIFGSVDRVDEIGIYSTPLYNNEGFIAQTGKSILEARMKEGLTTFFDATLTTDVDRKELARIALKHGIETEVLIFDLPLERVIEQDSKRKNRVGIDIINHFNDKFERTSELEHDYVDSNTKINFIYNTLPHNKIDVIGDTDGIKTELVQFLKDDFGYELNSSGVLIHPDNRKVLFLGDFVDRSPESVDSLLFVKKQVEHGHFAILGNHENKLITFYRTWKEGEPYIASRSSGLTAMDFARLDEKTQKSTIDFLKSLPFYYVYKNFAFTHAYLHNFDPLKTPRSFCLYGDNKKGREKNPNIDVNYENNYKAGINNFALLRGHAKTDKPSNYVMVLDRTPSFENGALCAVSLDEVEKYFNKKGFNKDIIKEKSVDFDFESYAKNHFSLYSEMMKLKDEKLAVENYDKTKLLKIFKYSKNVFFKQSWSENHNLLDCRGIVFDLAGNIAQYPFTKVFNYQEPNERKEPTAENVSDESKIVLVDKLNGFLGCITKHPFKNDLLITTTGSFASDFVGYIKELVKKNGHYGNLMKYCNQNQNQTLMFEVIHPDDPHIIKYNEDEMGLYLIGVRSKELNSIVFSEKKMDSIGLELGIPRPKHRIVTFGEAKSIVEESELEGYMIREPITGEYLCKFKTPYYLTTKFLGRLSINNTKMMYANKDVFKQKIDEEFFPIVDLLVEEMTQEQFLNMENSKRTSFVRGIIDKLRNGEKIDKGITSILQNKIDNENSTKKKLK